MPTADCSGLPVARDDYHPNDPWVVCQRSGWKVRYSETVNEPATGLRVRKDLADPRHPSEDIPPGIGEEIVAEPTGRPQDHYVTDDELIPVYPSSF